jgi:hypothetical protein
MGSRVGTHRWRLGTQRHKRDLQTTSPCDQSLPSVWQCGQLPGVTHASGPHVNAAHGNARDRVLDAVGAGHSMQDLARRQDALVLLPRHIQRVLEFRNIVGSPRALPVQGQRLRCM